MPTPLAAYELIAKTSYQRDLCGHRSGHLRRADVREQPLHCLGALALANPLAAGLRCRDWLFVEVVILAGQNAVEASDRGIATGSLTFFKTLGGAIGAAALCAQS